MDIEYFMDKLQPYEIDIIIDNLDYTDRFEWEQTRIISYIIAQVNSTKKLSPSDLLPLPWDEDKSQNHNISDSEILELKNKAKDFEQILQKK